MAAIFAAPFGGQEEAHCAGGLHDLGKIHPDFQHYLLEAERREMAGEKALPRGPDHKGAGALLAASIHPNLALLVAGHHGGLSSQTYICTEWLPERASDPAVRESIRMAAAQRAHLKWMSAPKAIQQEPLRAFEELGTRMLFSALVDADSLDTERHFRWRQQIQRQGMPTLDTLATQFEQDQQRLLASADLTGNVNQVRHQVYQACLEAAISSPGFFRLTVPTGGGKTRSSLAFAFAHARTHGLRRIIYAVPYLTITEQTAETFRSIFSEKAVLEHHSSVHPPEDPQHPTIAQRWMQLAAENWDAPIIVTTTVQLFESLFARTRAACRKLHNIARSILILDETQMLPPYVLTPILDVLKQLVALYGVSVVFCTATQPALDPHHGFPGLEGIHDILPDPIPFFVRLKRVIYQWPAAQDQWTWQQVAERAKQDHQALIVVNTRADAVSLVKVLESPHTLHLSTSMCGVHRRIVLGEVWQRLQNKQPCYLVSTQLIEAGVNLDFPLVMRALGPLDSILQAAGRGNREGLLTDAQSNLIPGTVIVFDPAEGHLPPGAYTIATGYTRTLLAGGKLSDADTALSAQREYFERYYHALDLDKFRVQESRQLFDYPETARRFRMVEEETISVVVPYHHPSLHLPVESLLEQLRKEPERSGDLLRQLQPYMVQLRISHLKRAEDRKFVREICPGLWVWTEESLYHPVYGIEWDEL